MGRPEMAPQTPHGGSGRPGEAVAPLDIDPVRASFDRIAERYAADFADELTRKPWDVERLRRFGVVCPPGPVLDVGCGAAGHVGRFVADLGPRPDRAVIGVDFSDYKGMAIDVELHHRPPAAFAAQVRRAGFAVESVEVRPPYAFEHATERLYLAARAV